jgi:glutamate N-acetyltransferase/amino-acid N-acetyltransferase
MIKNIKIYTTNCGIKYKNRDDLLFVEFPNGATVAGVFTKSSMPAASINWCKKNIDKHQARALIVNSGNANAFTGIIGEETVKKTANTVAKILKCKTDEVFISSTGVIGEVLDANLICNAIMPMIEANKNQNIFSNADNLQISLQEIINQDAMFIKASQAIMTTDTNNKIVRRTCQIKDNTIHLVGFVKGSGMIAPNMATMLGYIFTDAKIAGDTLQKILEDAVEKTFNCITVDSDQSTNDTVLFFATNGVGDHQINDSNSKELHNFILTLNELCLELAKKIVIDGEGAKKLIEISVENASSKIQAKQVANAIANSPLVKTAMAGADPNWGRIVMAVGKSCEEANPETLLVKIGDHPLTQNGAKHPQYSEELVHQYLKNSEIKITVNLGIGSASSTVWTCDLNEEYIRINKDYRS